MASPTDLRQLRWREGGVFAALAAGVGALAFAGCSNPPDTPSSISSSSGVATESPAPTFGTLGVYSTGVWVDSQFVEPARTLDTADALNAIDEGLAVDSRQLPVDDSNVHATAINGQGVVAGVRAPRNDDLTLVQSETGVLGPDGNFEPFPTVAPPGVDANTPRQSESTAINATHVAWVETPSTDLYFDDWSVFAADLESRETVALGSSHDILPGDTLPIVGPYVYVTIGEQRAFWGTPYPKGEIGSDGHYGEFGLEILARSLDGSGALQVVADGAILPAATPGDCVVFARVAGTDPAIGDGTYVISEICGAGDEVRLVEGEMGPSGKVTDLAAGDGIVTWGISDDDEAGATARADVLVLDRSTGSITDIGQTEADDGFVHLATNLAVGDRLVAWDGSAQFIYDADTGILATLPGEAGASNSQLIGGTWVGWNTFEADKRVTTVALWVR